MQKASKEMQDMLTQASAKEMLDLLNQAIAREIQVSIQYMWQHVLWRGVKAYAVKESLRKVAIEEMRHAEAIAERLNYLGGVPTTKPAPVFVGETLKEQLQNDARAEVEAIEMYKRIIDLAKKEHDDVTEELFRHILSDEEEHHDMFTTLLEEV